MLRNRALICAVLIGMAFVAQPRRCVASGTLDIQARQATENVTITFNDPYTQSTTKKTEDVVAGQFLAYFNPNGSHASYSGTQTLYTFCVDLLDNISLPSSYYAVNPEATSGNANTSNNLANNVPGNGNKIAYLYNTFGSVALTSNQNYTLPSGPTVTGAALGAALQLAFWNLLDPGLTFTVDSGDPQVTTAYNYLNTQAATHSQVGVWLQSVSDPNYNGPNGSHTGQSFLYPGGAVPNVATPEPASLTLAFSAVVCAGGFGFWRRRRIV
jgi:hypothetical protein